MKKGIVFLLLITFSLTSCIESKTQKTEEVPIAQRVVDESIAFHGMEKLDDSDFSLTFRKMQYTYSLHNGVFEYTRNQIDSLGRTVLDILKNEGLTRLIESDTTQLEEEKRAAFARSVNSVIYFFRLPFGLNDPAAKKTYQGETEIEGKTYHEVRVTFEQEGGGEDFDDVFLYWFDKEDYSMDFMAYLYHTDGGGLRFRKAINSRRVNGMLIQDYINYKPADESIDINTIDELFNAGELIELSRIINEDVVINQGK